MNNMITIEYFRNLKNRLIDLYEKIENINQNEIHTLLVDFFKVQNELLSYDLSNIPASEWKDINLLPSNVEEVLKDENIKLDVIDLSKTKANIDFNYFFVDREFANYNFTNCNITNLEEISHFSVEWFDQKTLEQNKDILLSDNFPNDIKNKIYNEDISLEEIFELPDNLFEEIASKNFVQELIRSSSPGFESPLKILFIDVGFILTRELHLNHKDEIENIAKTINNYDTMKDGFKLISSFDDIKDKIENIYNTQTNIIEIAKINRVFPISNYDVDVDRYKPYIIKHLSKSFYHIDEINEFYPLDIKLNDLEKKNIIEEYIKNNGFDNLYSISKVMSLVNITFDKEIMLNAFYKSINERVNLENMIDSMNVIDLKKYLNEEEIKLLLNKILFYGEDIISFSGNCMSLFKSQFLGLNIDYSDMKEDFIKYFDKEASIYTNKLDYPISDFYKDIDGLIPYRGLIDENQIKKYVEHYLKNYDVIQLYKLSDYVDLQPIFNNIDFKLIQDNIHRCILNTINNNYEYGKEVFEKININNYIDQNWLKERIDNILNDFNLEKLDSLRRLKYTNINFMDLIDKNRVKEIINDFYRNDKFKMKYIVDFFSPNELQYIDMEFFSNELEKGINNSSILVDLHDIFKDNIYSFVNDNIKQKVENLISSGEIKKHYHIYNYMNINRLIDLSHLPNILNNLMKQDSIDIELIIKLVGNHKLEEYLDDETINNWIENEKTKEEDKYKNILLLGSKVDINKFLDDKCRKIIEIYNKSDSQLKEAFFDYYKKRDVSTIDLSKIEISKKILTKIEYSNSTEIRHIGENLLDQLLPLDDPMKKYDQIERIFIKNNIPYVGKIFSVFQILKDYNIPCASSTVLANQTNFERQITIFSDLLKCAVKSGNRDLKEYIDGIEIGNELFLSLASNRVDFSSFNEKQIELLNQYINQLYVLYENTVKGKKEYIERNDDILENINNLLLAFSKDGKFDYNLPDRIVRMFGHFAGYDTIEDIKKDMETAINMAHNKGIENAQKPFNLEDGDFIKGIGELKYLGNILQNGSIAADFLGDAAHSDCTPLDTDLSIIIGEHDTIGNAISDTYTGEGYGDIMIVLKNQDGRFLRTRKDPDESNKEIDTKLDKTKLEAFSTGARTRYGIRTGFPSAEIDYILVKQYENRIGFEIARNGFYIPVVDRSGKLVFTIDDYNELRNKMDGLSKYGTSDFKISSTLENEATNLIASKLNDNEEVTANKRKKVQEAIGRAMTRLGLDLHDSISKDLTEGFVELIDTGSTGRSTNVPNDGDFDFMMKLDQRILIDSDKLNLVKSEILKEFKSIEQDGSNNGDFRYKGVSIDGLDEKVDIDITFVVKTNKITYSTDMCVRDRLNSIKEQHPDKYNLVIANIIVAKKILKKFDAYKAYKSDSSQGGLGGVGVENWILQHGGSFEEAARDFLDKAQNKEYSSFKEIYPIWDFGENHIAEKKNVNPHDNFIYNMSENGFDKMKKALTFYLEKIKSSDYSIVEELNKTI